MTDAVHFKFNKHSKYMPNMYTIFFGRGNYNAIDTLGKNKHTFHMKDMKKIARDIEREVSITSRHNITPERHMV